MSTKFGITKETQGSSVLPIPAPIKLDKKQPPFKTGYEFPICNLVKVHFNPAKEMTIQGVKEERPVLEFLFKDAKNRQLPHIEFPIDENDDKFNSKLEWMNQRIMHLWEETIGINKLPEEGIGTGAASFAEYFKAVADAFNAVTYTDGEKEKVLYPHIPLYIKLTYNRDRVQLPIFPNFVQRAKNAKGELLSVEKLDINPTYDKIEPAANTASTTKYSGGTDNQFGGGVPDDEFPDV